MHTSTISHTTSRIQYLGARRSNSLSDSCSGRERFDQHQSQITDIGWFLRHIETKLFDPTSMLLTQHTLMKPALTQPISF